MDSSDTFAAQHGHVVFACKCRWRQNAVVIHSSLASNVVKYNWMHEHVAVSVRAADKIHTFISCHLPHMDYPDDVFHSSLQQLQQLLRWAPAGEKLVGLDANIELQC